MASATIPAGGAIVLPSTPLTLMSFTADMVVDKSTSPVNASVQTANEHDATQTLPDHAVDGKIVNALTLSAPGLVPQSLYVEFFWQTSGATAGAKFKCQVNFEEIGVSTGGSLDMNTLGSEVNFTTGTSDYKDVIKVDILSAATAAATNLRPGLYTVSACLFIDVSGSTGLGAFAEVGKIMIA